MLSPMLSPKLHLTKRANLFYEAKDNNNPSLRSSNFQTTAMFGPDAVSEFKKSIEAEKNLIHEFKNSRSVDKNVKHFEKSYKLQIQSLLEENNQLKLDLAVLKKKLKPEESGKRSKEEKNIDDYKVVLLSKDSLIKELEFQINDLTAENRLLRIVNETQMKNINQLEQDLVKHRDLEQIVEESNEEIGKLKSLLHEEDSKQNNLKNQINFLQAELVSQKSNTIGDLTNIGENGVLYSFLDDSQENNNNYGTFQGNFRKKLKKAMSQDMRRFNSQKVFKSINENSDKEENLKQEEVLESLKFQENRIFKRKLKEEKENLQVEIEVGKYKLQQIKKKNDKLLNFIKENMIHG